MAFEDFATLLKSSRERVGLTQKELGDRTGISRQAITNWEGYREPKNAIPADEINGLSTVLGIPVFDLLKALGYDVRCPGMNGEEDFLAAYMSISQARREVLRSYLLPDLERGPRRQQ